MIFSTVSAFKHICPPDALMLTDEQLYELQKTLSGMLQDIADLCEKEGICYELGGGSALGAVRHKGFIPWDDDIDLNMPRADHDRFVTAFVKEYGDRYWIHTPKETKGYGLTFTRVLKKGTCVKTREDFKNPDECGAFIDIFVIENTYDNAFLRGVHGIGCLAFGFLQSCAKFYRDRKEYMEMLDAQGDSAAAEGGQGIDLAGLRRIFRIKIAAGAVFSFFDLDRWTRITDRWYSRCKDETGRYVAVPAGRNHFYGELYLRSELCRTIQMPYEGRMQPVPAEWDAYLKRLYGDYMLIPEDAGKEKHIFYAPFKL